MSKVLALTHIGPDGFGPISFNDCEPTSIDMCVCNGFTILFRDHPINGHKTSPAIIVYEQGLTETT